MLASVGCARARVGRAAARRRARDRATSWCRRASAPGPGRIRNSNGVAVLAQARWAGAQVRSLGIVPDDAERITEAIEAGLDADVLVVSGGVSAGAYDLVEAVLARVGVQVFFERVAIKPGAPLVFGRRKNVLVFGLPGNPVSAQVTFDIFVRAALLRMQGARAVRRPRLEVELLRSAAKQVRARGAPAGASALRGRPAGRRADPLGGLGRRAGPRPGERPARPRRGANRRPNAGERAPALLLGNFLERDGVALP